MGCYIAGVNQEFVTPGNASLTMVPFLAMDQSKTINGRNYAYSKSISIGMCVDFCLSNGYLVAGLLSRL